MEKRNKQVVGMLTYFIICLLLMDMAQAQDRSENNTYLTQNSVITEKKSEISQISDVFDKKISAKYNGESLKSVLEDIEKKAGFQISYSDNLKALKKSVTANVNNITVDRALWKVLEGTGLRFAPSENDQIVLKNERLEQSQEQINGTVTDVESGDPLPGVNVLVKGTTTGTSTDSDGNYELSVENLQDTLIVSFVGYQKKQVPINGRTEIDVSLKTQTITGEEMVVVGYGEQKAEEVTGAVSSVGSEELEETNVSNASSALQGSVSGVTAVESNTPGEGASIRVRGLGTINNNNPLVLIDGVEGSLSNVSPKDIKSVNVLKDAASQAIYGARASNGVVLVTTKSGNREQDLQVDVSVNTGVTQNTNSYDLLNTQEYGDLLWLQAKNDGINNFSHPQYGNGDEPRIPDYILPAGAAESEVDKSKYDRSLPHEDGDDTYIIMKANKQGTDWMDKISRNAAYQDYHIGVSGGSEKTTYSFQMGYLEEEGVLRYTGYNRYNIRSNITSNPNDWLKIGEKAGITYSKDRGNQTSNDEASAVSWAYRMQPIIPVHDIMGNYAGTRAEAAGNAQNPVRLLDRSQNDETKDFNVNGNVFAEAFIGKDLKLKSLFGVDYYTSNNINYDYVRKAWAERGKYDGLSEDASFNLRWNWSNTLKYSKTFAGLHDVTILAGVEAISYKSQNRGASRDEFFSRDPLYMQLDAGVRNQSNYGNMGEWSLFSQFGRLNYEFSQKYLIEAVIRRDGSSRFGEENRYGVFPAFSAAWRIANEDFMEFSDEWLNELKLRAGYGQTGNDRIGNYNAYTTYASSPSGSFFPLSGGNSGAGTSGFYRDALGNPSVEWETTTTTNIGIDATIFGNLDITVEWWKRVTEDMLYPQQIPDVRGQVSPPSINVGKMKNNGIDVELGYQGNSMNGDLFYAANLTVSHYKNELQRLSARAEEFMQGSAFREMSYTRAETGTQFPEFYGYKVEGIFQNEEEADTHPTAFGKNGDYNKAGRFKYKDVNGDDVINSDDRTYIGDPHPDLTAGLNIDLQYKGFKIHTRLYASYGNEMVNYTRRWIDFNQFLGNRSHKRLYESWGSPYLESNKNAKMPIAESSDTKSQKPSSYFVEDASYLRMQQLRLGYDLGELFDFGGLRNLRIHLEATNLFTITGYSGLDPEVNTSGIDRGVDRGSWPTTKRYILGIDIGI